MSRNSKGSIRIAVVAIAVSVSMLTLSGVLHAHGGATGIVKERMEAMKDMGKSMKAVGAMVKGKSPFDEKQIQTHAGTIKSKSPGISELFPKNSIMGPSEALPSIWQDWGKFSGLVDKLTEEAGKLESIAASGDRRAITMQFAKVGKLCSSCHTDFRKKKDE